MNRIIILNNKTCRLESEDKSLISKVKKSLSYIEEGFQFSIAHKVSGWMGHVCLMSSKRNEFSYPLLTRVKSLLKDNGAEFEILDKRNTFTVSKPLDISERLKEIGLTPRDYQQAVVDVVKDPNNNVGIFRLCTAAGKTLISALAYAQLNKPTMVLVIGVDLLYQFHELYSKIFPNEKIGLIGDGNCIVGDKINIATVQTIGKSLKMKKSEINTDDNESQEEDFDESNVDKINNLIKTTKVFFLDECHCAGNKTLRNIFKASNPEHFYGLSGTPFKSGEENLEIINYLGEKLLDVSATDLISRGVLPQALIKFINVPSFTGGSKTYHEVYREAIVDNDLRNLMIMNNTKELVNKGYKTLVLFKTIDHGKILSKLFKENNIKYALLSGKDNIEKRNKVKEQITSGKIDVIIASVIFDIGIDIPILSAICLAGSGKSYVKALQRVGRILRPYPGKKHVAVVDFFDNVRYLKGHARKRLEIYRQEAGFKLFLPKNLK